VPCLLNEMLLAQHNFQNIKRIFSGEERAN